MGGALRSGSAVVASRSRFGQSKARRSRFVSPRFIICALTLRRLGPLIGESAQKKQTITHEYCQRILHVPFVTSIPYRPASLVQPCCAPKWPVLGRDCRGWPTRNKTDNQQRVQLLGWGDPNWSHPHTCLLGEYAGGTNGTRIDTFKGRKKWTQFVRWGIWSIDSGGKM